jgi:hypothetical protein
VPLEPQCKSNEMIRVVCDRKFGPYARSAVTKPSLSGDNRQMWEMNGPLSAMLHCYGVYVYMGQYGFVHWRYRATAGECFLVCNPAPLCGRHVCSKLG